MVTYSPHKTHLLCLSKRPIYVLFPCHANPNTTQYALRRLCHTTHRCRDPRHDITLVRVLLTRPKFYRDVPCLGPYEKRSCHSSIPKIARPWVLAQIKRHLCVCVYFSWCHTVLLALTTRVNIMGWSIVISSLVAKNYMCCLCVAVQLLL